jgi:hypothetical protein
MMNRPMWVKCCMVATVASLVIQATFSVGAQALVCTPGRCNYLPSIARPPYLPVSYLNTSVGPRGQVDFLSYIENTSPFALTNIVLHVELTYLPDPIYPMGYTFVYTKRVSEFQVRGPVLGPGEYTLVATGASKTNINAEVPLLNLSVLTWTVALTSENQPISVTSIFTTPFVDPNGQLLTKLTYTLKNPYPYTLRDVEAALWFIDNSGQSTCVFIACGGRTVLATLNPSELFTYTEEWRGTGYIPMETIRVSAHGVISP